MPAKVAQHEGRFTAEVIGYINAVANGNVGTAATDHLAGRKDLASLDGDRLPQTHRQAIHSGVALGAGQRNDGVAMKFQCRPDERGFQSCGAVVIANNAIGNTEGVVIHGAGWRYANIPISTATGVVLHCGVGARLDDFERRWAVGKTFQVAGRYGPCDDIAVPENLPQVIQIGGNAAQASLGQSVLHFA